MKLLSGTYSKFFAAAAAAADLGLQAFAPHAHWLPAVVGGIGALLVYLVPNAGKPAA